MYAAGDITNCTCRKTGKSKTSSGTQHTEGNHSEYELDFGTNDIKRDVIPAILPQILERFHEGLANVSNSVDLRKLQSIVHLLEETERTTDQEELGKLLPGSSSISAPSFGLSNKLQNAYQPETSQFNQLDASPLPFHVLSKHQNITKSYNCTTNHTYHDVGCTACDISALGHEGKDTQTYYYNRTCRLKRNSCIIVVAITSLLLIAALFAYAICSLTVSLGETNFTEIFGCSTPKIRKCEYTATNYEEYNNFVLQRKHCHDLSVKVNVEHFTDWPAGVSIYPSPLLKELFISGRFHSKKLVHLISQTPHLEILHLDNFKNELCSESQNSVRHLNMTAEAHTVINKLTFDSFAFPCKNFLTTLERNISFNKLEEIQFLNGIVDKNESSLEKILGSSKNTLKRIIFKNSTINRPLFGSFGNTEFSTLSTLHFDVKEGYNSPHFLATASPTQLGKMFPNLNNFSYAKQLITLKEFEKIYALKNLKTLRISIELPQGQISFNVGLLSEHFPCLESADFIVRFEKCVKLVVGKEGNIGNSYEGLGNLSEALRTNLRIESNCKTRYFY